MTTRANPGSGSGGPPYERFTAWQACHQLALTLYRQSAGWPRSERYGLTAQARRAALSAAVNIVEGSARRSAREFRQFLNVAIGSLAELSYHLRVLRELELITSTQWGELEALRDHAARLTWGLYQSVGKRVGERFTAARPVRHREGA